jgi:hypothetical protein
LTDRAHRLAPSTAFGAGSDHGLCGGKMLALNTRS